MMFCPKCGTQQAPIGRVCGKCNAPLSSITKVDVSTSVPSAQTSSESHTPKPDQYHNPNQNFNSNQNFNPLPQPQNILPPINQNQIPDYTPKINQPAPPPWSYQATEQERQKIIYPSIEIPKPNDEYNPGQYLQPFAQNYQPNPQPYFSSNNSASNRAIWALIFSILSFVFCPIFAAMIGVTLSYQELEAIEKGLASPAGKPLAQIGYYLGMANMILYAIGICLIFLLTIL